MSEKTAKHFKKGENLITEGEMGETAFIIESGRVEVLMNRNGKEVRVGTRGVGSLLGEMAMLDTQPRTATVRALEDCKVLEISHKSFTKRVSNADPILKMVLHVILTRYRDLLSRSNFSANMPHFSNDPRAEDIELSNEAHDIAVSTLKTSDALKKAIERDELELFYQPIIDVQNNKIAGFEALMRWIHPEKGIISPGIFIPVAEDSGLIVEMSRWALDVACKDIQKLQVAINDKVKSDTPAFLSVNFSVHDFSDGSFSDHVCDTLAINNTYPEQIKLEITESLLMEQPEVAKDALEKCRQQGIRVAIDDFGTGYSSLSYLHFFPIDTLKIDQSFIRSMLKQKNSYALVKSIVGLAKNLGMNIIAEGIETPEEAAAIKQLDCEMCQGFWFARPMPLKEAIAFCENWEYPEIPESSKISG